LTRHPLAFLLLAGLSLACGHARAEPQMATESPDQALCRLIETAAATHGLPAEFLTRLIWRESSFRPQVTSMAGAQGIAQFMPGTAAERGLLDPYDPEQAIPASAHFLAELNRRFGGLGLAAAAYNSGPNRVADWLAGRRSGLPIETQDYVFFIMGRTVEEFRGAAEPAISKPAPPAAEKPSSCLVLAANLRRATPARLVAEGPWAPWGVQLSGAFSKAIALSIFQRTQARYAGLLGDTRPMVIGTRLRSRGTRVFYRVRAPAATRADANSLCGRIRGRGGACIVLRS
jgi:hypothetical protein